MRRANRPSTRCRTTVPLRRQVFYVFDLMILAGKNVMSEPPEQRRKLLEHT
jgi:ATP-dependent DNA ligase